LATANRVIVGRPTFGRVGLIDRAVPANVFGEGGAGGERLATALVDLLARIP